MPKPRETMKKQALTKDDGRLMILYTFETPAGPAGEAPDNTQSKGEQPE